MRKQHFRIALVLVLLQMMAGCVTSGPAVALRPDNDPSLSGKYTGADAGYLIMSLAARKGEEFDDYSIFFRKRIHDRGKSGVGWSRDWPFDLRKLDIDESDETGIVDVRRLPPGDYGIFDYDIVQYGLTKQWKSNYLFWIPFTIKSGQATYIGEFLGRRVLQHGLFQTPPADDEVYFVVTDKAERDVAIAKQKEPGIGEVSTEVTPSTIGYNGIR